MEKAQEEGQWDQLDEHLMQDGSLDETLSHIPEETLDLALAARKLKGLVTHTHHKKKEAPPTISGPDAELQEYLQLQQELLAQSRERLEVEMRRLRDLEANKSKLDQSLSSTEDELRQESFLPLGKPRHIDNTLAGLRKEMGVTLEEMEHQRQAIHRVQADILRYENEVLRTDGKIRVSKPPPPDPRLLELEAEEEQVIAGMRVRTEEKAANLLRGMEVERRRARDDKAKAVQEKIAKQIEVAAQSHKVALERIMETAAHRRRWTQVMVEKEEQKHHDRVEAILELKANTDKMAADIRGRNEKAERRRRAKEQRHAQLKEDLTKVGLNPYVVFKQRDLDREALARKEDLESRVKARQEALASRIIKDMDYERKEEERKAVEKAYEKAQRDQLGRHVIEERNRQYLMERTKDEVDIIDPTGRAMRIDPSQVTTIMDRAFGLGYNPRKDEEQMRRILDLVRSDPAFKDVDAGEFARLLPKRTDGSGGDGGGGDGDGDEGAGGPAWLDPYLMPETKAPGQELWDEPLTAEPTKPETDDSQGFAAGDESAIGGREMSKFEVDCLEKARQRHRDRMETGTPQVVGNRVFKGHGFSCRPEVIEFKDFTIDRPHRKRVIITNVSLTFNRFKLRDLPDEYRDFFEITYERPGRMCPGMTCAVDIVFTPKVRADIRSELSLLSETGPVGIPLICTYPRVVPSLSTSKVTFENVVKGEKSTFMLTIRNDGALPTTYTIGMPEAERLAYEMTMAGNKDIPGSTTTMVMDDTFDTMDDGGGGGGNSKQKMMAPRGAVSGAGDAGDGMAPRATNEKELVELAALKRVEWLQEAKKGGDTFRFATTGEVGPYSQVTHAITFAPLETGTFSLHRVVTFTGDCGDDESARVCAVEIAGTAIEVPIYVPDSMVDMKCCVYDKLYRKDVLLVNRGKIAYKLQTTVPRELQGMLEFSPSMGFIQPGVDFVLQMKFRPHRREALRQGGRYLLAKEDGSHVLAVPVQVMVPNQVVPVYFTLKAQLTPGTLALSTTHIRFGECCYTTESYVAKLTIKNESHLAQKVGFMDVPQCLDVRPNDGFNILLPLEELEVEVVFHPTSATHYDMHLQLRTTMNTAYKVRVTAQGVDPPITLSHSVLKFAAACPGDVVSQDIVVTNRSKQVQSIEFSIPHPSTSHLRMAPVIASLAPSTNRRVSLWFCPPVEQDEENCPTSDVPLLPTGAAAPPSPAASEAELPQPARRNSGASAASKSPTKGAKATATVKGKGGSTTARRSSNSNNNNQQQPPASDAAAPLSVVTTAAAAQVMPEEGVVEYSMLECNESHKEVAPEPWSRHARWLVPCFIKPSSPSSSSSEVASFVMLEVHTTTVSRLLSLEPNHVDFGEMAVGQKKTVSVRIRNRGPIAASLEVVRGLNACGNFSIVNAVRTVPPEGGIRTLLIQFQPIKHGISTEVILLRSKSVGKELFIKLQGEGVNTALVLEPPDGCLDFGQVVEGKCVTLPLTLTNTSPFTLRFELRPVTQPHENFNHHQPFQCLPSESEVPSGQCKTVEVTFAPDHARIWSYTQTLDVLVPGQTKRQYMNVRGRCWRRQLYVTAADPQDDTEHRVPWQQEDAFTLPPSLSAVEASCAQALGLSQKPTYDIRLRFPRGGEEGEQQQAGGAAAVRRLWVGSASMPGGGATAGTYELEMGEEAKRAGYFTVTPDKGSVAPEARVEVVFTYRPPQNADKQAGSMPVGQWVRYPFKVHLKGGYKPAPQDPDLVTVVGSLEAFVYV